MNSLDLLLTVALISAGLGGYRLGFITRVLSWIFLGAGALLALRLLPALSEPMTSLDADARLMAVVFVVFAAAAVGQMIGLFIGAHVLSIVPHGPMRFVDKFIGTFTGMLGVMAILWLLLPTVISTPGFVSAMARDSFVASTVYTATPPPPNIATTLRYLTNDNSFPTVFEDLRRSPQVEPAPAQIALPATVLRTVSASTVKVEGEACRRTQNGSGFVVGNRLIATNAHVVAGERATRVRSTTGEYFDATVVHFDPQRDLALLSVPRFAAPPLPLARADVKDEGAVFGHPGGQDELSIAPAVISQRITAQGRDLYDQRTTRRNILVLASNLRQGDSGGALVNPAGQVVGVAFAIAPDRPGVAYALDVDELRAVLNVPRAGAVPTGQCLAS